MSEIKLNEDFERLLDHLEEKSDVDGIKLLVILGENTSALFAEFFELHNKVVETIKPNKILQEEDKK